MVLRSLCEVYGRISKDPAYGCPRRGYSTQKVVFRVVLRPDGSLVDVQDARVAREGRGKAKAGLVEVPGGAKPSGSGLNPCFLWDKAEYLLGVRVRTDDESSESAEKKDVRVAAQWAELRARHLEVEEEIGSPAFSVVCRFLETWDPANSVDLASKLKEIGPGFGVFQLVGDPNYVHEDPQVVRWWEEHGDGWRMKGAKPSSGKEKAISLLSGKPVSIARLHEPKIKGLADAQSTGAVVVGFNLDAFESYGKTQGFNAPIGAEEAWRYATTLNAFLTGPLRQKHSVRVAATTLVFWTERPSLVEDVFARFLGFGLATDAAGSAMDEGVRSKLEQFSLGVRTGRVCYEELDGISDDTGYCLLGLSANAARVVVRFFHRSRLGQLLRNLQRHVRDTEVIGWGGRGSEEVLSVRRLLAASAPLRSGATKGPNPDDAPAILLGPLVRAVVLGSPYPPALFQAVMGRLRADRRADRQERAAVIAGYLRRNLGEEVSVALDEAREDPAYRLGRLFAVLEKTQSDALGESLNATIRDRFYGAASAAPASVFPRLLRTYQHHLSKLEGGRRVNRERLIQEVLAPLAEFPAHLDLTDQGRFALGYYHQRRSLFTKRAPAETE